MAYQPYISEQDSANKIKQFHKQQNPRTPFMQPTGNKVIPYTGLSASEAYIKKTYPERYDKPFSKVNSDQLLNPEVINSFPISGLQQFPDMPVASAVPSTTPAFSKDFNVDGLELGLPKRNLMDFNIDNPFKTNQQNTEVQSPIIKADTSNADTAHNDFMQRYLEQATNNFMGVQGMNSANSATAYNNMLEASIARGANSRSKGSYHPIYQKAVTYTPQAMNFGSTQEAQPSTMLGMFDNPKNVITPNKSGVKPSNIPMDAITQNGQSIWNPNGTVRKDTSIKQDTMNFFNKNAGVYLPGDYETSQDRINKMNVLARSRPQGSYNPYQTMGF